MHGKSFTSPAASIWTQRIFTPSLLPSVSRRAAYLMTWLPDAIRPHVPGFLFTTLVLSQNRQLFSSSSTPSPSLLLASSLSPMRQRSTVFLLTWPYSGLNNTSSSESDLVYLCASLGHFFFQGLQTLRYLRSNPFHARFPISSMPPAVRSVGCLATWFA